MIVTLKLTVEYDGSGFIGYELQPGKRSVRDELGKALKTIFNQPVKFAAVSRTDSGVHALCNVISFSVKTSIPINKVAKALNSALPEDIRIIKAEKVKAGFNARFDAKNKEYEYLVYNGDILPPNIRGIVWHVKPKLDIKAMQKAARTLVGRHDFSRFCAAHSDDTDFVRTIHSLGIRHSSLGIWHGYKIRVISIRIRGDGFLYKMVRNIAGHLVEIGLKKPHPGRRCAPPQGLCLIKVNY